jgi:hypothetical protein
MAGGDQGLFCLETSGLAGRSVLMLVTQHIAPLRGQSRQHGQRLRVLSHVRGAQSGRQRAPPRSHRRAPRPLPPLDPAGPARRGPVRRGRTRGVRDHAGLAVRPVPHASPGTPPRAGERRRPSTRRPRPEQRHERPPQPPPVSGQGRGHGLQPPLPGAARRKATAHGQQRPQGLPLWCWLGQPAEQRVHRVQRPHAPPHQGRHKQAVRRGGRPASPPRRGGGWNRYLPSHFHQRDTPRLRPYPRRGLRISVGVATAMMRRWPREGQALARPFDL